MKVLLIGSGGREHALAWKIASSPLLDHLYCISGNPGIAKIATCVMLDTTDHAAIITFCKEKSITLVVVGPEAPLVAGIGDDLRDAGIKVFGPSKAAAQLEGSKGFAKDFCTRFHIPTSAYSRFDNAQKAKTYIREKGVPIVVKADGLAAGKGVIVAMTLSEALNAVDSCFEGVFGNAGTKIVVEEYLEGEEVSFFCLCDGKNALPFGTAQDHKRVGNGDIGANTGGMGAYSPASIMAPDMIERTMREVIEPTIRGMVEMGTPYTGVLFAGLMMTKDGPKLIEYNVRFGDPECQVLMMRLKDDLLLLFKAATEENLGQMTSPHWYNTPALTVVMAACGYPVSPIKDTVIQGLDQAESLSNVQIFHAGTAMRNGNLVAHGGRVLNVTAIGETVAQAQTRAYAAITRIDWPDGFCRSDIGWRAIAREKAPPS